MVNVLKIFKNIFNNHPIIANSVIYGGLFVGAEFSQQLLSKKILVQTPQSSYDKQILGRCAFYGTFIQGPILSTWYRWLDKKFKGHTKTIIIKKLLLDQFTITPAIIVIFYVAMSLMENKQDILGECKQKFLQTFISNCSFWMPAQIINFSFVPSPFRVTYVGSCSFIWVNILCYIKKQNYNDNDNDNDNKDTI